VLALATPLAAGPQARSGDRATGSAPAVPPPVAARFERDLAAVQTFRPSYPFWRHVFTLPDGAIAFGSGVDGGLIAHFPARGDWHRDGIWKDPTLARALAGRPLPADAARRRDEAARRLESSIGPIVHNPTRGLFLLPNARRYGAFLDEWGAIYERFGVPARIGPAQAIVESGLNGTVRSEARAVGFCQWLPANWERLKRLSPHPIEGHNQTTQAPYCAAYLSILATKYGSFIPALSEHHTGGTNTGRTLINGERLGGTGVRERYFLGAAFARSLRAMSPGTFKDVYGTYGPRSFLYAEMVFGNTATVAEIAASRRPERIFAMRTTRVVTLAEIAGATRLSTDEIRRFNPALLSRVPARATLYLPTHVEAFGRDIAFWHRTPSPAYASTLNDFAALPASPEQWDHASFEAVLQSFRKRLAATGSEEGAVMATTLAFVLEDRRTSHQAQILAEFRSSERIRQLFEQARLELDAPTSREGSGRDAR
jgi:hypothetical protein